MKSIFSKSPTFYGVIYLCLIPAFGVLYYLTDGIGVTEKQYIYKILESMYFSVVTITTLGYGDVTPLTTAAKIVAGTEAVSGVVVIGLFLSALAHRRDAEDSEHLAEEQRKYQAEFQKNVALSKLRSSDAIIHMRMNELERQIIHITSPLLTGEVVDGVYVPPPEPILNRKFQFSDMKDLYHVSLDQRKSIQKRNIHYFYKAQDNLLRSVENLITEAELFHWKSLEIECINYLNIIEQLDASESIIGAITQTLGSRPHIDSIKEMIEEHKGPVVYLDSNSINPYVSLYHSIQRSIGFMDRYRELVAEIIS